MYDPTIQVLAVDDERDFSELTKVFLERSEVMAVNSVSSAKEAMAELAKKQYDVIVSDYQMPEIDGIQFLKSLRAAGDNTPFILFTGKGREEVVIEALNNGVDSYLQKGGKSVPQYAELEQRINVVVQRHRGEEALARSERRFKDLFEATTSGVAIYSVRNSGENGSDYILRDFNRKALEMEGKTKEEVVGRSLLDLRPNIDEFGLIPILRQVWQTGVSTFYPSKEYVDEHYANWYENTVFSLPSGEIVAIYNDVTERKRTEADLAKSRALLSETERLGKIGGWTFDVETLVQTWTDETFRILEIDLTEGEPEVPQGLGFIAPAFRPMADEAIQRAIQFGENFNQEWEIITAKGNRRWVHAVASTLQEHGKVKSVSGSFQDITDRKLVENALKEAKRKLDLLSNITGYGVGSQSMAIEEQ